MDLLKKEILMRFKDWPIHVFTPEEANKAYGEWSKGEPDDVWDPGNYIIISPNFTDEIPEPLFSMVHSFCFIGERKGNEIILYNNIPPGPVFKGDIISTVHSMLRHFEKINNRYESK